MTQDLDHLVFAGPDLAALVAEFERLTGVAPTPGGRHVGRGTANHLVKLGENAYLELIGPDPESAARQDLPRPFGIDGLSAPRLVTWAVRAADLDDRIAAARADGYDPGDAKPLSRRTPNGELLEWRLTPHEDAGIVPFLIDWGGTTHPASRDLPLVPLVSLAATHPEPEPVRAKLAALGVRMDLLTGNRSGLTAVLNGRHGRVVLS
ncbi:VOC family protein [Solihabitans fulvus]|uniref:VOC family protein n=1 Tax=Solihabitans fulvus TaxID=1892852 RepID=A0A5B2WX76_9PSEU|nr:VOC family protein [Solihabitans fulvus]KAA2256105.1 VOC family protein [Solihabitans fulvus]